jgi:hypothetical protein
MLLKAGTISNVKTGELLINTPRRFVTGEVELISLMMKATQLREATLIVF